MRSSWCAAVHQLGHGDGAGIDHGVERPVGDLVEHDGVERLSGRLDPDFFQHTFPAMALKRIAVHERLRHRLDGEGIIGIADGVDRAVDRGERDAEAGGIGLGEFGNVVGGTAAGQRRDTRVEFRQVVCDGGEHRSCARLP